MSFAPSISIPDVPIVIVPPIAPVFLDVAVEIPAVSRDFPSILSDLGSVPRNLPIACTPAEVSLQLPPVTLQLLVVPSQFLASLPDISPATLEFLLGS